MTFPVNFRAVAGCGICIFATAALSASGAQLLQGGGFESPKIAGRVAKAAGGDPARGRSEWKQLADKPDEKGGRIIMGLTNEMSRKGKQSLFVEFEKVTATQQLCTLSSDLVSVAPGKPYHVAIWGRLNKKNPLTLDQRQSFLRLQIEFYQVDKETQIGESVFKIQPIPGSKNRPPLFTTGKWGEYFADVTTPEDAAFMKITWGWATPPQAGETTGMIYFDDAVIEGEPGPDEVPEVLTAEEMQARAEAGIEEPVPEVVEEEAAVPVVPVVPGKR